VYKRQLMDYERRSRRYRLKITSSDLKKHKDFIKDLIRMSKDMPIDSDKNDE